MDPRGHSESVSGVRRDWRWGQNVRGVKSFENRNRQMSGDLRFLGLCGPRPKLQ